MMVRHPLARRPEGVEERDDVMAQRDEATVAELRSVVATAIARSRNGSVGTSAPGLRPHFPFRRSRELVALPMDVPDGPPAREREHGTYLAIWCHRLERVGDRLLAYGSDDDGRPVRWIDELQRLGWLEDELSQRDEPIPVTIGHWQLV